MACESLKHLDIFKLPLTMKEFFLLPVSYLCTKGWVSYRGDTRMEGEKEAMTK